MEKVGEVGGAGDGDAKSVGTGLDIATKVRHLYFPAAGYASFLAFSARVTNPKSFRSIFSPHDALLSNALWLTANVGTGCYIFTRRHVQRATPLWRTVYSVAGALVFNFGSVLIWATVRVVLPLSNAVRAVFGVTSGIALLEVARRYLEFVDNSIVE